VVFVVKLFRVALDGCLLNLLPCFTDFAEVGVIGIGVVNMLEVIDQIGGGNIIK